MKKIKKSGRRIKTLSVLLSKVQIKKMDLIGETYKMKHLLSILIIALVLAGCQKEYEDIIEPDKSEAISADDNIADLILNVVLNNGSYDNLIDRCSEISIKYPYSILINDQLMEINSKADIDVLYIDYFQYRDDIEIQYPITVLYSDYTETVLSNSDDLEKIQEQYNTKLIDDDIECIDFIYPIEINIYNTTYQKTNNLVAHSDEEMYEIFQDLTDIILEIKFPIELETINGEKFSVDNNFELENLIDDYKDNCDENDDVVIEDTDYPVINLLTSDSWYVSHYSDTSDETQLFSPFSIDFKPDFSLLVTGNSTTYEGSWEYDDVKILSIEIDTDVTPLIWLNNGWEVLSVNNSEIQLQAESDSNGFMKKLTLHISE
tara:strand:+ start:738 stop:1865 length:1128 start_codon:yes stop_codon:yes gene_type:complete